MKNWLLLLLVKALRCFALTPQKGHILVVTTTALGDTLWATPAIEALSKSFPTARIAVLTSVVGEEVLRHNPAIHAVYVLREPMLRHFHALWRILRAEAPETIVIFHASQRLILPLCAALGARRICGTAGINKGLDALLTDAVAASHEHEILRRLRLVERVGAIPRAVTNCAFEGDSSDPAAKDRGEVDISNITPRSDPLQMGHCNPFKSAICDRSRYKRGSETLSFFLQTEERLPKSNAIVLHPGARDSFRRWPAVHFVELGKRLAKLGHPIVVTGSAAERTLIEQIASQIPGAMTPDPARSLRSLASLLESAALVITNDTGPAHLACALKTPLIMLFACTDPALFGPHHARNAHVIVRRPTCDPCLKRNCRLPFCQLQITPGDVFELAQRVLHAKA